LKLAQKAMNHRSIKTMLRYAHVLDEEVTEAMERIGPRRRKGFVAQPFSRRRFPESVPWQSAQSGLSLIVHVMHNSIPPHRGSHIERR
jgi:hypothetical protein